MGSTVDPLHARFAAAGLDLVTPGDPRFDELRRVHNGRIDQHPAGILSCRTAADVAAAVALAAERDLGVSALVGGHDVTGRAVAEGALVLDLRGMADVDVDREARRLTVGGGALWGQVDVAAAEHGLATTGAAISSVGVVGATLGGGYGWLMGRYGMSIDNVEAAEVVTADGEVRQVDERADEDLFWALRGGGSGFGVVTALRFTAHPVERVHAGILGFDVADHAEVLPRYLEVIEGAPDELMAYLVLLHAPDGSGRQLLGVQFCYCGVDGPDAGEAAIAPLRRAPRPVVELVEHMPYPKVNTLLDPVYRFGARTSWKSSFVRDLGPDLLAAAIAQFRRAPSRQTSMVLQHFHGRMTRPDAAATAYPHRAQRFNLMIAPQWDAPEDDAANLAWLSETHRALAPHLNPLVYLNYLAADDTGRVEEAVGANLARLRAVKRAYDPQDTFAFGPVR